MTKELIEHDYFIWERRYLSHDSLVSLEEIKKSPESFIFFIDFFGLNDLLDLMPSKESVYINSGTQPFNDMMSIEEGVLSNWLDWAGIDSRQTIHASGHFDFQGVEKMVNAIGPRWFMLIHTEHPEHARRGHGRRRRLRRHLDQLRAGWRHGRRLRPTV